MERSKGECVRGRGKCTDTEDDRAAAVGAHKPCEGVENIVADMLEKNAFVDPELALVLKTYLCVPHCACRSEAEENRPTTRPFSQEKSLS